jgi:hypothetical protein
VPTPCGTGVLSERAITSYSTDNSAAYEVGIHPHVRTDRKKQKKKSEKRVPKHTLADTRIVKSF